MWPYLHAIERDRENWLKLFKSPFNPYVELTSKGGRELLLLRADSLTGFAKPRELFDAAKLMVRQMNNVVIAMMGESQVAVNGTCEDLGDRFHCTVHFEPGTIKFRFGMGSPDIQVYDVNGNLVHLPPAPTFAQRRMQAAAVSEAVSQALLYCGAEPDWFDLYKAFECLRDAQLLGPDPTKAFTQTANAMFRHRRGRYDVPANPMSLEEAQSLVRRWILDAADRIASAGS